MPFIAMPIFLSKQLGYAYRRQLKKLFRRKSKKGNMSNSAERWNKLKLILSIA